MRITCPYCGSRDLREFTCLGEAQPDRARAPGDACEKVYLRDNPAGRSSSWWSHDNGCRSWLLIERDSRTHEIFSVALARQETGQ